MIDRNSNLEGKTITLERSANDSVWTTVFSSLVIPSSVTTGDDITATPGVLTEEGAWVYRFGGSHSDRYWRLTVAAGGAGFFPQIGGLYLGEAFVPGTPQVLPHHKRSVRIGGRTQESDRGWIEFASRFNRREGTLHMKLDSIDADDATTFFNLWKIPGAVAWICQDNAQAERTFAAIASPGAMAEFFVGDGWWRDTMRVPYLEHEPKLV